MMHVITGPLNIYTVNLAPVGARLKNIDFETTASFGINSLKGFTWKDLLDLDACTECGRCTSVCPANTVGKELSSRDIILDLRKLMHDSPLSAFGLPAEDSNASPDSGRGHEPKEKFAGLNIIDTVPATSAERLWQCTTCAACMETCPVFVEQMPKIVDMRRYQVMEQAEFPESMQEAVTSLESRGHPFRGTQATRLDWAEGLDVRSINDMEDAEVLLWVGCSSALLDRNQKIIRATVQLRQKAGVRCASLAVKKSAVALQRRKRRSGKSGRFRLYGATTGFLPFRISCTLQKMCSLTSGACSPFRVPHFFDFISPI
jgi:heterodisulfide reductase subunit C